MNEINFSHDRRKCFTNQEIPCVIPEMHAGCKQLICPSFTLLFNLYSMMFKVIHFFITLSFKGKFLFSSSLIFMLKNRSSTNIFILVYIEDTTTGVCWAWTKKDGLGTQVGFEHEGGMNRGSLSILGWCSDKEQMVYVQTTYDQVLLRLQVGSHLMILGIVSTLLFSSNGWLGCLHILRWIQCTPPPCYALLKMIISGEKKWLEISAVMADHPPSTIWVGWEPLSDCKLGKYTENNLQRQN